MNLRTNIWSFALTTALLQSADWFHLGHTTVYDLYIDSASIQRQGDGRVAFRVKREYSHDQKGGEPLGSAGVEFVAIGELVADCVRRTVSVMEVTIQSPSGKVLAQEKTARPTLLPVEPGSVGEAELKAACGLTKPPVAPHP